MKKTWETYYSKLNDVYDEMDLSNLQIEEYIDPERMGKYKDKVYKLINDKPKSISRFFNQEFYKSVILSKKIKKQICIVNDYVDSKNNEYLNSIIKSKNAESFKVGGYELDENQKQAAVFLAHNHIVLAGAGAGKSMTIIGKIKYLLNNHIYNEEDILVLSFTAATVKEMNDKIRTELSKSIDVKTFHGFGMDILKSVHQNRVKNIDANSMNKMMQCFDELSENDPTFQKNMMKYCLLYPNIHDVHDFEDEESYLNYLSTDPYVTLKGDIVKSYGEVVVSNYLYEHGIKYEYERPYEYDTVDETHRQYFPDFYLIDYDVYIEYYGVDRKGRVGKD